jgi:hypothetical protein
MPAALAQVRIAQVEIAQHHAVREGRGFCRGAQAAAPNSGFRRPGVAPRDLARHPAQRLVVRAQRACERVDHVLLARVQGLGRQRGKFRPQSEIHQPFGRRIHGQGR